MSTKPAQDEEPAKPLAPTPGPTSKGSEQAKLQEDVAKAVGEVVKTTAVLPPSTPAAKAAAVATPEGGAASATVTRDAVTPATAQGRAALGKPEKPTTAAAKALTLQDMPTPPGQGKAAALVSSSGAPAAPPKAGAVPTPASAGAATPAAAKAVPSPTSPAAVTAPGQKPISALERLAAIGSVLSRGAGAVAEPVKAKPAAPTPKGPASVAAPKAAATPSVYAAASPSAAGVARAASAAPASVLDIVSGTPQPALESILNKPAVSVPVAVSGVPSGPAKIFAKMASPALAAAVSGSVQRAADVGGKPVELPKEGPAAVAVGRAIVAGAAEPIVTKAGGKPKTPIGKKYQIVFVSGEVAPYSKTGGLGEAMDGLPVALAALGHRVMVISPRYDQYKDAWDTSFWSSVTMAGKEEPVHFFHAHKQKVDHVFVDHPCFLERVGGLSGSKLYGPEWGKDFADNQARFAYFCKAALVAIKELPLAGYPFGDKVMVVANDWHTALVPMLIHAQRAATPSLWARTKTAFLCHNAVFQGRFVCEEGIAQVLDVPQQYIDSITFKMPLKVGKYNPKVTCINTMAAGIRYSDRALTVSPSYAKECSTDPEKGVELEELFALGKCTGILNGVKEGVSPADKNFTTLTKMSSGPFTPETMAEAKAMLKASYRQESGLPEVDAPLMCFIGRLDAQKGYDLLLEALVDVLEDDDIQVVIVGAGRADLVQQTKAVEAKFPTKFFYAGWMGPERYAMLAGADYTLLPSRWEPCGLVQMEAMRMGTLPIVAPTGGLKDTVEDGVNGLWTDAEMTVEATLDTESITSIARALRRAADIHKTAPVKELRMKQAAMAAASEFTWSNAALQYEAVFEELGVECVLAESGEATVTLEVDKQVC